MPLRVLKKALDRSFIFFRSEAGYLFENNIKVFYIVETAKGSDFLVGTASADQKLLGTFDTLFVDICGGGAVVCLVKKFIEISAADMGLFTYLVQ